MANGTFFFEKKHWKPINWQRVSTYVRNLLGYHKDQCVIEGNVMYIKIGKYYYYSTGRRL